MNRAAPLINSLDDRLLPSDGFISGQGWGLGEQVFDPKEKVGNLAAREIPARFCLAENKLGLQVLIRRGEIFHLASVGDHCAVHKDRDAVNSEVVSTASMNVIHIEFFAVIFGDDTEVGEMLK